MANNNPESDELKEPTSRESHFLLLKPIKKMIKHVGVLVFMMYPSKVTLIKFVAGLTGLSSAPYCISQAFQTSLSRLPYHQNDFLLLLSPGISMTLASNQHIYLPGRLDLLAVFIASLLSATRYIFSLPRAHSQLPYLL
jgi:hypothetical protein